MKKVLICILLMGITAVTTTAQQQLPLDPKIKVGKLDNGLTYILRHNEKPAGQADFYIAQRVGSILENDDQQGLAHFLEHMCFNGTKHFPGKSMINWLESVGVKFGYNLNAYTSIDETVYNISNVPLKRATIADSCLLVLHDWSCALTLDPKEIDAERGVIHEEWRTRENAQMRILTQTLPIMYQGDKYAYRLPIGTMEVVDNFKPQVLVDYYHRWYRPDLQCIIVVGDIDVDEMEKKIRSTFADVKMPANAAVREYVKVSDNKEPIVAIATDKELSGTSYDVFFKHDPVPMELRNTVEGYAADLIVNIASSIMNERLSEMSQKPTCPFLSAGVDDANFLLSSNKKAFTNTLSCKDDSVLQAIRALTVEVQRAVRYGFTEGEFDRVKANLLSNIESSYNERANVYNDSYSREYVRHFISGEPVPGIEKEFEVIKQLLASLPLEAVNMTFKQLVDDTDNVVFLLSMPEKEGVVVPTKEQLLATYNAAKAENIEAFEDEEVAKTLIETLPTPGKVVKEKKGKFGSTELTLSNGIKVIVKPTDYMADEISFRAFSPGGSSLFDTRDIIQYSLLDQIVALGGCGDFSNKQLSKMLAGSTAGAATSVSGLSENINGGATNKDVEKMFQLAYLKVTSPRQDKEMFQTFCQQMKNQLKQTENLPMKAFQDSVRHTLYGDNPRVANVKASWIDQIDYDRVMELYRERFADCSDFTFVFVGNIDIEKLKPLLCQYVATLPSIKRKETWRDNNTDILPGRRANNFEKELETKKSTVLYVKSGNCKATQRNRILMSFLSEGLNDHFLEVLREQEGGTYGASVRGSVSREPKQTFSLMVQFDTDPAKRERMIQLVEQGVKDICLNGPKQETIDKTRQYMLKNFDENQKNNSYWMNQLINWYRNGEDTMSGYKALIESVTVKDIVDFAKLLLKENNEVIVSMSDNR